MGDCRWWIVFSFAKMTAVALAMSFRELDAYRLSLSQAKWVFTVTKEFPKEEMYSLTDQVRRSSRAVGALVAEAWARRRYKAAFITN